jgi:hypothetical protein
VYIRVYGLVIQSTQLCKLLTLSPSLWLALPLPSLSEDCKYTVYTYTVQCVRGGGVWVHRRDGGLDGYSEHLPQSPIYCSSPPYTLYTCILYTYSLHSGKVGGGGANQRGGGLDGYSEQLPQSLIYCSIGVCIVN